MPALLTIRKEFTGTRAAILSALSFLIPLGIWSAVSYVPWLWHPEIRVTLPGHSDYKVDDQIPRQAWDELLARVAAEQTATATSPPPSDSRALEREQLRRLRPWAEILVAQGLIEPAQSRNLDLLRERLQQWRQGQLSLDLSQWSPENLATLQQNAARAPELALLPLLPQGVPCNPVFLPAPHAVAQAMYTAFTSEPRRRGEPWLHQRLAESAAVIGKGFGLALLFALPLGLLAGTFDFFRRLLEPFTAFFSYLPPPAFGALLIAIFGLADGPKNAMVFIAAFFPLLLMVAKTVRLVDMRLLEAAQVLGARPRHLIVRVLLPASLPNIWNDIRIVLAMAWTILIIAEITGERSGISAYINTMGRYRQYENMYAAVLLIGLIGLTIDKLLSSLHPLLFPWAGAPVSPATRAALASLTWLPRLIHRLVRWMHADRVAPLVAARQRLEQRQAEVDRS